MNILLLGSGGREHALAYKIIESPLCSQLYIAPGNAGTNMLGKNCSLSLNDFKAIGQFCLENNIEMLIVGPEDPLVLGIYDYFKNDELLKHIYIIGPSAAGAQLEGSKAFAKKFMQQYGIPTAAYQEFTAENYNDGIAYIREQQLPIVLKADGLAAGKGVIIAATYQEAEEAYKSMLQDAKFGQAGAKVVIEEFLDGIELSVFALTDGKDFVMLPSAKDYKRIGEGDTGLNTGGMGAVSPVPFADDTFMKKVIEKIVTPTIQGIHQEGFDYFGFVFFGLIKVKDEPYVIEYNCRLGDPETEVILPRLGNDLVDLFKKTNERKLNSCEINIKKDYCTTVILVSGGYPEDYQKGKVIKGLSDDNDSLVFHAGTIESDGAIKTNGGRVLAISSFGQSLPEALNKSYKTIDNICFEEMYFRKDIGHEFL